jgi:ribosomal-protein-alanine N-acetyltransferase
MTSGKKAKLKGAAITGTRVFLRPPAKRDLEEFVALNRASLSFHRGLVSPPINAEQFTAWLKRSRKRDNACFLICLLEDQSIVGSINLSQIFRGGFQNAYLGYYLGAKYAGQGYMTEAVGLILKYTFQKLKLHRLEANIQPGNRASIEVARRAGFTLEGYSRNYLKISGWWRDHERWAIIAEDWRAGRKRARASAV